MNSRPIDPIPAFRFEVSLGDDLPVAGFSEVGGLSVELEVQEYAEGGINTFMHKFPGRTKHSNVTLKRGIVDRRMWDWFYELTLGRVKPLTVSIRLHDPSGTHVMMEWYLYHAIPIKWSGPELNATQNSVAVESLELAHHGLQRTT
jgi:phage tail-like protein